MIKLMILNCLELKQMSVYDIKLLIKQMDAGRWGNVLVGSIQNAILTLEKNNNVKIFKVEKNGKRKKTIYQITETGKKLQRELTIKALSSSDVQYSSTFFLGLSVTKGLSNDEKIELLERRLEKLNLERENVKKGIKIKEQYATISEIQKLSIECMISTIELQLNLTNQIIRIWRNKNEN